jgi:hypothetical protein
MAKHEAERRAFTSMYGAVKDIISTKHNELRFVATGKKLHYAKNWKVFKDFLGVSAVPRKSIETGDLKMQSQKGAFIDGRNPIEDSGHC